MAENTPDQEPSIEEILASIRQIISDDEGEAAEPVVPEVKAAPAPAPQPVTPPPAPKAPPPPVEDVFELTEIIEDTPVEPEPEPEPEPVRIPRRMEIDMREAEPEMEEPEEIPAKESILTPQAATAARQGFAKLTNRMAVNRDGNGGLTIEDVVREMLRPMLREWLDGNLPQLIEKLVQKEIDDIARRTLGE